MLHSLFKQTLKPIQKAFSLHPHLYQDRDIFQKELKTIFKKSWIPIGYTNQFQTDKNVISSQIANKPIIITQDSDQTIRTFYNVCRHRGCKLVKQDKKANLIVCPYHSWSYKLDGSLMKTPQYKPMQEEFNKTDYNLFEIKTQVLNNIILANPDGQAINSHQYYSGAFQDLEKYPLSDCKITHQKQYHVKCNWKLLIDNFIEYYHLPSVHPSLTRVSGVNEHQCTQKDGKYIGFMTDPLTNNNTPLDYDYLPPFPGIPKKNRRMAIFHAIYPNQFYFLFPHHIFSIILQPVSADYTIEHATLMGHSDMTSKYKGKFEEIWKFYDQVNTEDLTICQQVQEGIQCEQYQGGKLVPKFEETIHRFHQMIIEDMKGTR